MLQKNKAISLQPGCEASRSSVDGVSPQDQQKLKDALVRYECLLGLTAPKTPYEKEMLSADRKNYCRYIPLRTCLDKSFNALDFEQTSKFLNEVSGCDLEMCKLYLLAS